MIKVYLLKLKNFFLIILTIFFIFITYKIKISKNIIRKNKLEKLNKSNEGPINAIKSKNNSISYQKCYISLVKVRTIHLIITRFLIEFYKKMNFQKNYIQKNIFQME